MYDRDETYNLARKLMDGDEEVISELALRYDFLAINRAVYIGLKLTKEELEDAIGEARYAIMKALSAACGTNQLEKPEYISGYLIQAIKNKLLDFKSKLSTIRVPLTTLRRRKEAGKPVDKPKRVSGHLQGDTVQRTVDFEYPSILEDSSLTEIEKAIITLKLIDKCSFIKIAEHFNKSRYWVKKIYNEAIEKIRNTHGSI
jgi:RNA polymerase sigma factor (sigma-70 family)